MPGRVFGHSRPVEVAEELQRKALFVRAVALFDEIGEQLGLRLQFENLYSLFVARDEKKGRIDDGEDHVGDGKGGEDNYGDGPGADLQWDFVRVRNCETNMIKDYQFSINKSENETNQW